MLKKKRSRTLEESWTDQEIVQSGRLQDNERLLSKCSKFYSRWMIDNWMLDKRYRVPELSWSWEGMMQKAWAQGFQQGFQQGLPIGILQRAAISIVAALFPGLEEWGTSRIIDIKDLEHLQQLILDLSKSRSQEQMERVLLSLGENHATQP